MSCIAHSCSRRAVWNVLLCTKQMALSMSSRVMTWGNRVERREGERGDAI